MQSNVAIKYYISACTYTLLKLFGLPVIMSRRRVPPTQTQIKEQVAQRVSARLKDKHTQHIIPDQSSPLECGIASQREHDLTKISKLSVPEKSMKPISTPSVTAPPIISIHTTPDTGKVLQRYHPHNVDRREKRKNERISKLRITVQQKDVEIKKLQKAICKQEKEFKKLQHKLALMTEELCLVKLALTNAYTEVTSLKKQHTTALKKVEKLKKSHDSTVADCMASEATIERLEEEKLELKEVISEFQELKKML